MKQLKAFDMNTVVESETTLTKVKAEIAGIKEAKRGDRYQYPGAALLLQWVKDVVHECEVMEVVRQKEAEVDRLQKQLDDDNQRLIKMRGELERLATEITQLENEPQKEQ